MHRENIQEYLKHQILRLPFKNHYDKATKAFKK